MKTIGFTGTRKGLTPRQAESFTQLMSFLHITHGFDTFAHGDCVGADADAHAIVIEHELFDVDIHPPDIDTHRAFCKGARTTFDPCAYLVRNRNIVTRSSVLVACPGGMEEEWRSGTWSTVRYARKMPKAIVIVWPSGAVKWERDWLLGDGYE